jgi:beta-phosphoglucomutase-like phosphatase (HAD superfamily)
MLPHDQPQAIASVKADGLNEAAFASFRKWPGIVYAQGFEISGSVRAALFDFNGTIVQTEPAYREALRTALCILYDLPELPDHIWNEVRTAWHMSDMLTSRTVLRTMKLLFPDLVPQSPVRAEELCALQRHIFTTQTSLLPLKLTSGASGLLGNLVSQRVSLSVVTGSDPAEVMATLQIFGLRSTFGHATFASDVGFEQRKPHPHLFVSSMRRHGVEPAQAVAFENSVTGALSAVGAGLTTVVATSSPEEFASSYRSRMRELGRKESNNKSQSGSLVLIPSLENVSIASSI